MATPLYLTPVDVSPLEAAIYDDGGLAPGGSDCLLLIDHNWSWTEGELVLGAPVHLIDETLDKLTPEAIARCRYAIVPIRRETEFQVKAPHWIRLRAVPAGWALYRNE